ncbi:DNA topoisomerase, partial [Gallibacterium genomosp. 3]
HESDKADEEEKQILPILNEKDSCQIRNAQVLTLKTTAPKRYTEGTLIAAMKNAARFVQDERLKQRLRETEGLGTEATRADVIENLLKRGYLKKEKNNIVSTEAGSALIDILPDIIKDPGMTALWEQALNDIANNKLSLNEFMQKQSQFIAHIVQKCSDVSLNLTTVGTAFKKSKEKI